MPLQIGLRLKTISSAMEQLRLRSTNTTNTATSDSEWSTRSQPSCSVRSWLHSIERQLKDLEKRLLTGQTGGNLTKLLADHQVLQLEIQTEGQAQISRLTEQIKSSSLDELSGSEGRLREKRRAAVEVLRKRWHELYLNSLVLQLKIEDRLNRAQEESLPALLHQRQRTDSEKSGQGNAPLS
ncbi:hypothetical protein WR25_17514 [Diploscapter pachys]|uniref:Uncharacterized protein n=1 Tax=Diploscapter pachys TaxID=2018661 RepID=A0A2A2L6I9_9BILA|nr:hypothetical protein WR25_17514 [Diploscapter pachys]